MTVDNQPPLKSRLGWAAWFVAANAVITLIVGLRYLPWINIADVSTGLYVCILYLGQFPLLAWLAGLPILAGALLFRRPVLSVWATVLAAAGLILLLLDTVVYAQYRFHLSGFVLELILGAGAQIFSFSWLTWALALLTVAVVVIVEALLARLLWRHRPRAVWLWPSFAVILGAQIAAHGWHAWADANYDNRITSVTRHVPLYYGSTAKRFMARHGLVDAQAARRKREAAALSDTQAGSALDYPKEPLQCEPPETRPNILVIAIDAVRADMLDPRWMPSISRFADDALRFTNHFSNGNATKPGIFTLFYGLPASYWDAFSATETPPVLIRRMQDLGYQPQVHGSATLVSPAFDRNVFSSIDDLRLETPGDVPWQRDLRITDDWLDFTRQRSQAEDPDPFFGFLFYDTTHSYGVPEDYPKIEPYWRNINQLELDNDFDPEPYMNAYKTAIRYVDGLVSRVLTDLRERDLLDNTIVIITSDHGQEFNDNKLNYWGHGSNFTDVQLKVPLVIHWPGKTPHTISRSTQHFDVAPTLLGSALGCGQSAPLTYASGYGLFAERNRDWTIAHSYMNYALLIDDIQVVTHPAGDVDILKRDMTPAPQYTLPAEVVEKVLRELSRFYQ